MPIILKMLIEIIKVMKSALSQPSKIKYKNSEFIIYRKGFLFFLII